MDDEVEEQQRARDRARRGLPQYKYKDILQKLADRKVDEMIVDLDDLATVRSHDRKVAFATLKLTSHPVRAASRRRLETCPIGRDEYQALCRNPLEGGRQAAATAEPRRHVQG